MAFAAKDTLRHLGARARENSGVIAPMLVLSVAFWVLLALVGPRALHQMQADWQFAGFLVVAVLAVLALVALSPRNGLPPSLTAFVAASFVSAIEGVFAVEYLALSTRFPCSFNEHLSKASAAYFAITTATTTGFGDIHPVTDGARLWVTGQMVASLLVVAVGLGSALERLLQARSATHEESSGRPGD
jgi:amino acid transporter